MIKWAIIFFVISLVAAVFGFTGIAADSAAIAKFLFFVAITIFVVLLAFGVFVGKKISS
jgi:uncharacterized membrane protein YtjA (UPF0391 family)